MTITYNNFYINTFGIFKACNIPRKNPSYISLNRDEEISSKYYYGVDKKGLYIIRVSDHWSGHDCNNISSCVWLLKNERKHQIQAGKIYLNQLKVVK